MKNKFALLLIILVGCQSATEEQGVPAYRIAYNVWLDQDGDDYDIFSMNPDGSDRRNITNINTVEWTYHASGQDILYVSDKDTCKRCYFLYAMDALGRNDRPIGGYQLKDSWNSTRNGGKEIIIAPKIESDSAFYIIDRNGALIQKVYPGLSYFADPSFSPDGNEIVFRGSNNRYKANIGYQDELYIVNVDGSGLRQLTFYPKGDTTAEWWNYHAGPPFWEPTRNIITYHSVQQGGSYLFQINPDGTGLKKLTPDSIRMSWHSWSPDGKMVVFDAETKTDLGESNYDIFLLTYESGTIQQISSDSLYEQSPVFVELPAQ